MNFFFFSTLIFAIVFAFASAGTIGNGPVNATTTGTCGGNCPGNGCGSCPCGTTTNPADITHWCAQYSGWNQAQCQCIMKHESGGNSHAMNGNSNGSMDVGLWQINTMNWGQCNGGAAPCGADDNLHCAKMVFAWGGNTFKLWSTCGACGAC
eukprot:gene31357-38733_t